MARKNSDSTGAPAAGEQVAKQKKPKKQRWYHQAWAAYQMTRKQDPAVTWVMLGVFVGILAVALGIGLWWGQWVYTLIVGIPFAALGAMFVLTRRAERAAYQQIEGQPGAARAALGTIRRGWTFDEEPVAIDPRTQDLVFRGVGRAGVVLVSEGPPHRAKRLLDAERKRVARVLPNVPVTTIQVGDGEDQVADPHEARDGGGLQAPARARRLAPADPEGDRPDPGPPRPQGPQGALTRTPCTTTDARSARIFPLPAGRRRAKGWGSGRPRSGADEHRARGAVVQAATVGVPHDRRDDEAEQDRAQQATAEADHAGRLGETPDPDPHDAVADGEPERAHEQHVLDREDQRLRPDGQRRDALEEPRRGGSEEEERDQGREDPVDDQRDDAPPERREGAGAVRRESQPRTATAVLTARGALEPRTHVLA